MQGYSSWEYYSQTYGGALAQEAYDKKAPAAAAEINRLTFGRAATAGSEMADALALCECRMADAMAEADSFGFAPGVTEVNNDGVSVSIRGGAPAAARKELRQIARETLCLPTNLLFGGAVVKNER